MKKILIIGFPHCGTTILRCILGKCSNVTQQLHEEYKPLEKKCVGNNEFYLMKTPFTQKPHFSKEYDDIIKIFIMRNPIFVMSSINKRFPAGKIDANHNIAGFIKTLDLFIDCESNTYKNTYTIRYEDMFINDFQNLKKICNDIGLIYSDKTFINEVETSGWPKENIPTTMPDHTDHERYRIWQTSQPFISNNDLSKLHLTDTNKEEILKSKTILKVYPEIEYLLSKDDFA